MNDLDTLVKSRELSALAGNTTIAFAFSGDSWQQCWSFDAGMVRQGTAPQFTLVARDETWDQILRPAPAAGMQSALHLLATKKMTGERFEFDRHMHLVRAVIEALRGSQAPAAMPRRELNARGEYHRVTSTVGTADIHVERCGRGQPVIALATAGSSSTQWHGLMTESDITDRYELITVDLPWHGSSSPTFGTAIGEWQLTPDAYSEFIADAVQTIAPPTPVLLGVSMAGAAVVHALASFPGQFAGAVACQAGCATGQHRSSARQTSINHYSSPNGPTD